MARRLNLRRHEDGCGNSGECAWCGFQFKDTRATHYEDMDFELSRDGSSLVTRSEGCYYCEPCALYLTTAPLDEIEARREPMATLRALRG